MQLDFTPDKIQSYSTNGSMDELHSLNTISRLAELRGMSELTNLCVRYLFEWAQDVSFKSTQPQFGLWNTILPQSHSDASEGELAVQNNVRKQSEWLTRAFCEC